MFETSENCLRAPKTETSDEISNSENISQETIEENSGTTGSFCIGSASKLFEYYSGNIKMRNVDYCYWGINVPSYSVVFIKKVNLLRLVADWCFPVKYMKSSEAATGGVLWKKLYLKILQYSQESCRPATLLKRDFNTCFALNFAEFLRTPILKNVC